MIPVYVRDVLNADPTNAVYIFAPAGIGFLIGMLGTPRLIRQFGARKLAVFSAAIMSVAMVLFGIINVVSPILAPISPLRLLGWLFGIEISDGVLAASLIAVPANFGSTAAGASVQTYINARLPIERQGATFGMQEVQENVFTLLLVLGVGAVSSAFGPQVVFVTAPLIVLALVVGLIRYSFSSASAAAFTSKQAFHELVHVEDETDDGP